MATSYRDIYCLNKLIKNDPRLKKLTVAEYNMLCFGYLKFAISYFMYDCRKTLADRTDPVVQYYSFIGNGTDVDFHMSPSPSIDSYFYITLTPVGGEAVEVTNYFFDGDNSNIVFPSPPADGELVNVTAYTYGSFMEDLDDREKVILAEAMNVPYLEEAKNDQNAMKYIVTGKSLRFFSQANHINASIENYGSQAYEIVDSLISEYSYKGSVDSYRGLAKRGRGV